MGVVNTRVQTVRRHRTDAYKTLPEGWQPARKTVTDNSELRVRLSTASTSVWHFVENKLIPIDFFHLQNP